MTDEARKTGTERELEEMRWVRGLAGSLVADAGLAEDVAQETLIAAWRHASGGEAAPRRWLATAARNFLRQQRRGEARRAQREERAAREEALPSPDELALRMERQRLLAEALTRLDEPYRSTVILRYSEELQPSEIARRLGLPPGTVRRRLKVGLDRLRADLDRRFEGDRAAWVGALLPFFAPRSAELALAQLGTGAVGLSLAGGIAMKKLTLAALALVLAGGSFWIARDALQPVEGPQEVGAAELDEDAGGTPRDQGPEAAVDPASAVAARSAVALATEDETPPQRLEGRVAPRTDAPQDPRLEVIALSEPVLYGDFVAMQDGLAFADEARAAWERLVVASGPVDRDGRFSLELPPDTVRAYLMLRGRFLYLPETREVEVGALGANVVLAPTLGACVEGTLTYVGDSPSEDELLAGARVVLDAQGGSLSPADGILDRGFGSEARSSAQGSFAFRALPIDREYGIIALPGDLGAARVFVVELRPGETRPVALSLAGGASVAGRVTGPDGAPIPGATVTAKFRGRLFGEDQQEVRTVESGADGGFVLRQVPTAEPVYLTASLAGYMNSERAELALARGERREGLVLRLDAGRAIAGRVAWPDGEPAAGIEVAVYFDRAWLSGETAFNAFRGAGSRATTDEEGRFDARGLGAGPFVVRCEQERDGLPHSARRDGIVPSGEELALVLHAPLALEGRVVDEAGLPLERFRVEALRVVEGSFGRMSLDRRSAEFDDPDGRFALAELVEGNYELFVVAEGHVSPAPVAVHAPRAAGAAPIVLETLRAARVRGRVLDPNRAPRPGAKVRVASATPPWQVGMVADAPSPVALADDLGRFEIGPLIPGETALVAEAEGYASSGPYALELQPGEELAEVELSLERGATLTGEVYDEGGRPAANWMVNLTHTEGRDGRFVTTDGQGRFAVAELAPGSWQVIALHLGKNWKVDEDGLDVGQLVSDMRMGMVELRPGAEEHVVLGTPPREPVRVSGLVTQGGEPRGAALIVFQREEGGVPHIASAGEDGRYEVTVDGGGTYLVSIQLTMPNEQGFDALDFTRTVPDVTEHRIDFELPAGRIAGLVEGPDGEPLAGARVTLFADASQASSPERGQRHVEKRTGADGRYSVDALDPGRYSVFAGGATFSVFGGGAASDGARHAGRVGRTGIELGPGEQLADLDFRLPEPGALEVSVLDPAGAPVEAAAVYVRDAAGTLLDFLSFSVTDASGHCVVPGLAPGSYTVFARGATSASAESAPVLVVADETERIELTLEQGTLLWVRSLDGAKEPVHAAISVLDSAGREVGNAFPLHEVQALMAEGAFSSARRRFGPLPPGRYEVSGLAPDGRELDRSVTLGGRAERTVSLRFKN